MEEITYRIIVFVFLIAFCFVRGPFLLKAKKQEKSVKKKQKRESLLVFLNFIGMFIIPLIYSFSGWLDFASISLPGWLRMLWICVYFLALIYLYWIHKTLDKNWSMGLELGKKHKLITDGPYKRIRHPMYLFFYIVMFCNFFISANLFVGVYGILVWTILCVVRIPDEEKMLLKQFGKKYKDYMERTGRMLPKF
jgi:protein-S-isoprenylcysteine O-methyltransferase Ste14